jgi:hypothetical protein
VAYDSNPWGEEDNRQVLRHNRDQCKVQRFQIQQYFNNATLPTWSHFLFGHISYNEMWDLGLLLGRICRKLEVNTAVKSVYVLYLSTSFINLCTEFLNVFCAGSLQSWIKVNILPLLK